MFLKKHLSFDSFSKNKNSASSVKRLVSKVKSHNAPFEALALELFELDEPLPLTDAQRIQELLIRDEVVLRDAVNTLVRSHREKQRFDDFGPLAEFERELYRRCWVSAMLLIHGSADIRSAIASSRICLEALLDRLAIDSVSEVDDDVVLSLVARVVLGALHSNHPKVLAAIQEWRGSEENGGGCGWVRAVVRHAMHSHYAPTVICSLMSERRARTSNAAAQHVQLPLERFSAVRRRGVQCLNECDVQNVLADEFCASSALLIPNGGRERLQPPAAHGSNGRVDYEIEDQLCLVQAVLRRQSSSVRSYAADGTAAAVFETGASSYEHTQTAAPPSSPSRARNGARKTAYRGERDAPRTCPGYEMTSPSEFVMRAVLRASNCAKCMQGLAERAILAERRAHAPALIASGAAPYESINYGMKPGEFNAALDALEMVTKPAPLVKVLNSALDLLDAPPPAANIVNGGVGGDYVNGDSEYLADVALQLRQQIFVAAMDLFGCVLELVELAMSGGGGDALFAQRVQESWSVVPYGLQHELCGIAPRLCGILARPAYRRSTGPHRIGLVRFVIARTLLALFRVADEALALVLQQSQAARLVLELALSSSRSSLLISVLGKTIVAASKENADAKMLTNGAARCRTQATLDILRASLYRDAYLIERLMDAYGSSDANMCELRSGPFMPIVRFLCERSRELETQCDASSLAKFCEIFRPVVDRIDAAVAEVPVKDSLFKGAQQSISQTIGDRGDSVLGVSHERASLELSASEFSGMHVAPNVIEDGGDALYFQMMLRMLRLVQEEEATGGGKSAGGASNQAKLLEFMGSIAKKRLKEKKSAAAATSAASTGSAHAQPAVSSAHPPKIPQGSLIPRTVSF